MSEFSHHSPCPSCGSHDNLAVYKNGSGHCFGCKKNFNQVEGMNNIQLKYPSKTTIEEVSGYPYAIQPKRRVLDEVYQYYNIRMSINMSTGVPDTIYYPGHIKSELAGFKLKKLPKDFKHPSVGSMDGVDWFGWHLIRGHKKIIIVEGEEDVAAVQSMIRSYWKTRDRDVWANVISPPMGVSSLAKSLEKTHDELLKFDEVIFIPDNDKDKKQSITTISQFIEFSKLKVIEVPTKDSSDMLQAHRENDWLTLYFNANVYKPTSIINIQDTLPMILEKKVTQCYDYPKEWKSFNYFTLGRRLGDFDILTSGTGCGKSQLIKEIITNDLATTPLNTGIISLEEEHRDTIVGLMSLQANKRLLDPSIAKETTDEEFTKHWESVSKDGRIHVVNHEGTLTEDEVLQNVTYLASCYNCKFIYVDNMGNIIPSKKSYDKLADTDLFLEKLRALAIKLKVWICLVVHLRKNSLNTRSFEGGAIPTESDLYGSSGISRKGFCIMAVQRNKHHSDEAMRNVSRLHVIKCRFLGSGRTGPADFLRFDNITGRMIVIPEPNLDIQEPLEQIKADI